MRRVVYLPLLVAAVFVPAATPAGAPGLPGKIAFVAWSPRPGANAQEVLVFEAAGSRLRSLTKNLCEFPRGPAWSRDGSMLAVVCDLDPKSIYVMWHDGTGYRRLPYTNGWSPSWSPDRRQVAFVDGDGWLCIGNIWGGRKQRLVRSFSQGLSWSPDGRRLVFDRAKGWTRRYRGIWVIGVDGRGLRKLRRSGGDPAWSPDGRRIAFDDSGGVWVMKANGGGARVVAGSEGLGPAWSPDSRWIATWGAPSDGVTVVPVDGGKSRMIAYGYEAMDVTWGP